MFLRLLRNLRLSSPVALATVFFFFCAAHVGLAGTEGQEHQAAAPAAPKAGADSKSQKSEWKGTVGGGLQVESGRTNGRGFMFTGDVEKIFSGRNTISLNGQFNHSTFQVGTAPRTYAAHNMLLSAQAVRPLGQRFFLANRFSFSRDLLLGVADREMNASGLGINLLFSTKGQFYIVPAFGYGFQSTSVPSVNGLALGFSGYQKFEYQLNKDWGIRQWAQVRTNKEHTADKSINGHVELNAPAIHKRVFLSFSLDYTYEGVLSPQAINQGATRNDLVTSVKLNYRVGR